MRWRLSRGRQPHLLRIRCDRLQILVDSCRVTQHCRVYVWILNRTAAFRTKLRARGYFVATGGAEHGSRILSPSLRPGDLFSFS